jgi:hypothetical protein
MPAAQRFFRLANEPGATGLSCNENGVHLGCVPLLRRTDAGFEPRPSYEIEALIAKAYRGAEDGARLSSGLRCIADCLNKGELARAMIAAVFLRLPDLDPDGAEGIAKVDALLQKYDPNEPRDRRGRWTTGAAGAAAQTPVATPTENRTTTPIPTPGSASEPDHSPHLINADYSEDGGELTDVAYNNKFHDEVVEEVAELAEEHGARVVTEVDLKAVNGATARADLIVAPADGGLMAVIEVKTGKNPPATAGQIALYPLVPLGNHVWPTNARMLSLGYPPGAYLPPMAFALVYRRDAGSDLKFYGLDKLGTKLKTPKTGGEYSYDPK